MNHTDLLNKWRHLLEPETGSGIFPMTWEEVLAADTVLFEGHKSVLLTHLAEIKGIKSLSVWVAAGELSEVLQLVDQAEDHARQAGCKQIVFIGRRGWIRAAKGYRDTATIGVKEL